jgi:bacterioferritin (cytochrome b1)
MKYDSQSLKSVRVVLRVARQELEHSTNYVERIVALKNTAEILKMLTQFKGLGEEIEQKLTMPFNVSNQKLSNYAKKISELLAQQIDHITKKAVRH